MFLTLEDCIQSWKEAGQYGTKEERIARNARWIPFYSYAAESQLSSTAPADSHAREVARTLVSAGILNGEKTVLDVGAGTGRFSLAFGEVCGKVTALDMDSPSLAVLLNRAKANGLQNIEIERGMWELYPAKDKFDVVFSSMCPAICDYDELLRMEGMAREACALMAVTRGSYDKHRKKLMRELDVHPTGMTTEALWYYDTLYLMGRQPNVVNFTQHIEYTVPVESAVERDKVYFEIFGLDPADSERKLRDYYEANSKDGMVLNESHINTALIWWKIPKD